MPPIEFHPDLVRFAFVLGIVVSILFYDRNHLTTGGIAVPGYLGFTVFLPLVGPAVLSVALVTYFLVHVLLASRIILSNAAKFSITILTSSALHLLLDASLQIWGEEGPTSPLLRGIGYVVPGLIAHDFTRHGIGRSIINIGATSMIVAAALALMAISLPALGQLYASPVEDVFPINLELVPMVVFLSLIAWMGLARLGNMRCGGFLGGAYMTLLMMQPYELLLFWFMAVTSLLIVKGLVEPFTILFGRRKLAAFILVGAMLSWSSFKLRDQFLAEPTLAAVTPSITVIGVLLTGLLANDIDRAGLWRVAGGSLFSVAFTLSGTMLVAELLTHSRAEYALPWAALMAIVGVGLYAKWPKFARASNASR